MIQYVESDTLILRKVQPSDFPAAAEYRAEFLESGDTMDGCSNLRRFEKMEDWYDWISRAEHWDTCPEGWVPDTQFLSIRKKDGKLIGMLDIRHGMNEKIRNLFGFIGYSVRKTERGKGYATQQLAMAKEICRSMGMEKILISCHKENTASAKVILRNGGVLENEVVDHRNGQTLQRYWITL